MTHHAEKVSVQVAAQFTEEAAKAQPKAATSENQCPFHVYAGASHPMPEVVAVSRLLGKG